MIEDEKARTEEEKGGEDPFLISKKRRASVERTFKP